MTWCSVSRWGLHGVCKLKNPAQRLLCRVFSGMVMKEIPDNTFTEPIRAAIILAEAAFFGYECNLRGGQQVGEGDCRSRCGAVK